MSLRSLCSSLALLSLACQASESNPTSEPLPPSSFSEASEEENEDPEAFELEASEPVETFQDPAASLGSDAEKLELKRQQRAVLSQHYVEQGDVLLQRGDLRGALEAYAEALEIQPSNDVARAGLRRVQVLLGDEFAEAADFFEDAAQRERVRRAQARLAVSQAMLEGDEARRADDYTTALLRYREAEVILRNHPLIAEGSLDEALVEERIRSTIAEADNARARSESLQRAEAQQAQLAAEEAERQARSKWLHKLYADAHAAFGRENYALAESLAQQILLNDPGNESAAEMKELAATARHQKTSEMHRRNLHEQWIRTFQDLEALPITQSESIVFDDLTRWGEVSQRKPISFSESTTTGGTGKEAIQNRLETTIVPVRFGEDGEGAPLVEVADYLQQATGVNFVVSSLVKELDEEETSVNLNLPDRSVKKLLDLMVATSDVLRWKIEDGVVKFVTVEELIGGQALRFYDVRDLIQPVRDFPGRDINVIPSGGLEPIDEDIEEREALVVTGDSLDALIRDNVSRESWEADPRNTLQVTDSGTLVVNQTPEVHDKIEQLLADLREATGIMVDIQARFLKVEDNFLEDIGVDFRGLGAPGLGTNEFFNDFGDATAQAELGDEIGSGTDLGAFFDQGDNGNVRSRIENLYDADLGDEDVLTGSGGLSFQWTYLQDLQLELILRAVSKSERVELVTAPKLLVHNTARANLTVLNQVAYIQDYDVEIAQAASIADPIVAVIEDGVILDVRPVVSADRRFITLEMRPTVAELRRPIPEFTTSLGGGTAVTIQLPELEISRVRTSVPMPDGSTVLLGGLKVREERRQESGLPILSKIPLVSFAFGRKGHFVTNRKLLILLRAQIVIPSEHEPKASIHGKSAQLR